MLAYNADPVTLLLKFGKEKEDLPSFWFHLF